MPRVAVENNNHRHEKAVGRSQDRAVFDCGEAALNWFLQRHAPSSHESGGQRRLSR